MDMTHHSFHRRTCVVVASMLVLSLAPALCMADGTRVAQKAKPGEIVLIRNVAARPADRPPTAPGMALMVSASPNPQLGNSITGSNGPGEMTDAEIANLNAGPQAGGVSVLPNSQRSLSVALDTHSGRTTVSNNGVSNTLSAPAGGAVVDSTRNIGDQVTNAISQIPLLGAGH